MNPPVLHQQSLLAVANARGIIGASVVQEVVARNRQLRQRHCALEQCYFKAVLPLTAPRAAAHAVVAVARRADVLQRYCADDCAGAGASPSNQALSQLHNITRGRVTPFTLTSVHRRRGSISAAKAAQTQSTDRATSSGTMPARHHHAGRASSVSASPAVGAAATEYRQGGSDTRSGAGVAGLVRQLELLRLSAPTPTMSDDIARAFERPPAHRTASLARAMSRAESRQSQYYSNHADEDGAASIGAPSRPMSPGSVFAVAEDALSRRRGASTPTPQSHAAVLGPVRCTVLSTQPLVGSPHRVRLGAGAGAPNARPPPQQPSLASRFGLLPLTVAPVRISDASPDGPNGLLCWQLRAEISRASRPTVVDGGRGQHAAPHRFVQL